MTQKIKTFNAIAEKGLNILQEKKFLYLFANKIYNCRFACSFERQKKTEFWIQ